MTETVESVERPALATSWFTKMPKDMTADELQAAKAALAERLGPMQAQANALSHAVTLIDYEVQVRFGFPVSLPPTALPAWPDVTLAEIFE